MKIAPLDLEHGRSIKMILKGIVTLNSRTRWKDDLEKKHDQWRDFEDAPDNRFSSLQGSVNNSFLFPSAWSDSDNPDSVDSYKVFREVLTCSLQMLYTALKSGDNDQTEKDDCRSRYQKSRCD